MNTSPSFNVSFKSISVNSNVINVRENYKVVKSIKKTNLKLFPYKNVRISLVVRVSRTSLYYMSLCKLFSHAHINDFIMIALMISSRSLGNIQDFISRATKKSFSRG